MFANQLRRAIEAAPRINLPAVAALMWRAYADGNVSESEAETLSGLIEARQAGAGKGMVEIAIPSNASPDRTGSPRTGTGSRPRTDATMERRRRWAASGRLPPAIAARFTLAEQAVLSLVAAETVRRKDCRLAVEHVAAIVGVCRSTVKNAVREARKLGLLTVEERPVTGFRNLPNVVRIVSAEWTAWLRLARSGERGAAPRQPGGGVKSATRTPTNVPYLVNSGARNPRKGCRRAAGDPNDKAPSRIRAGGEAGRAMR